MEALFDCDKSSSGFRSSQNAFTSAGLDLIISGLKFNFRSFGRGKSLGLVFNPSGNAFVLSFRNFAFNFLMLRRVADTFLDARSPNSITYVNAITISSSFSHLQELSSLYFLMIIFCFLLLKGHSIHHPSYVFHVLKTHHLSQSH